MARQIDITAGRLLKKLRTRAGLSQSQLGERAGVAYQQIAKYEKGSNRVTLSTLFDICSVLGTTPAEFITLLTFKVKK